MNTKKFNAMTPDQKKLYLSLADVMEKWAGATNNGTADGVKLIHEVMVTLTMAVLAFHLLKKKADNVEETPNGTNNQ